MAVQNAVFVVGLEGPGDGDLCVHRRIGFRPGVSGQDELDALGTAGGGVKNDAGIVDSGLLSVHGHGLEGTAKPVHPNDFPNIIFGSHHHVVDLGVDHGAA